MFQYLNADDTFQCEFLFTSKINIINMLIINIKNIPATYWTIKRQFLKFFKEFIIKISKKADGAVRQEGQPERPEDNTFTT